jgi:glucosyl-3-phosphoglycerate synthase
MLRIRSALVPVALGGAGQQALALANLIADEVIVVGIVPIGAGQSVSAGAQTARETRKHVQQMVRTRSDLTALPVLVSPTPWTDLQGIIRKRKPDLLVTEWKDGLATWNGPIDEALVNPPCNVAVVRGRLNANPRRTLVALRGGPYAELALQLALALCSEELEVLHIGVAGTATDAPFKGLQHILEHMPEVKLHSITTDDVVSNILEASRASDAVVLGTTASRAIDATIIGPVAEKLLRDSPACVILVKSSRPMSDTAVNEAVGSRAISILVDKWFAEKTFHADEFSNLRELMALKEKQGCSLSLALPALNEEKTVGKVIRTVKRALVERVPLFDEIVLMDSNSTDRTREIAERLGIPVYIHQELLPEMGARTGKGEALWKSLLVTRGDIIAWIDTDIINIHPRFVYGIVGPLLLHSEIQLVKGFYRRPLKMGDTVQAGGGGRVTELTARPLLNLFYPELSGVVQPLSGEYAGRRQALETAVFSSGYGVETGLLIDIFERYGLRAIAQVDLLERIHRNQGLEALSKMSFAICQTILRNLERRYERSFIEDVNKTMKLIQYAEGRYSLEVEEIAELERPPMASLPVYQQRRRP